MIPGGGSGDVQYALLSELKAMRRITDGEDDDALTAALIRASRAIERKTGRRFDSDSVASVRTFDPAGRVLNRSDGTYALLVDDIAAVDDIAVTGFSNLTYGPSNAIARGRPIETISSATWWGWSALSITARWGWPAVPDEIAQATLLLANRRFMRRDSPEGIAGSGQDGPIRVSRFDPDIEDLVEPFVIPGFGA